MEQIVYRKTLDVHKNGVQFTLQGFETADNMSRRIEISLMASGDTIDFPLEQVTAMMYVTTPNAIEPSVNECTIKDNTIIYNVLPIVEEGITEMQLKIISTRLEGANGVLATPKFAVEVSKSNADDKSVTQTPTYTALENAIAKAQGVYDSRITRIELDTDCIFKAYYADGTVYESSALKDLNFEGAVLLAQSYAKGGTGKRAGEDTDNSMYYSNVSRSAALEADRVSGEATELLQEVTKHGVYTVFYIDFETGEVEYISPSYKFNINEETGELEAEGEAYKYEDTINYYVIEWFNTNGIDYKTLPTTVKQNSESINTIKKELPIEDSTFANCDYRIVDDETEWYNPPMANNTIYRTTERYDGKPVYVMQYMKNQHKDTGSSGYVPTAIAAGGYYVGRLSEIPSGSEIIDISGTYATETSKGILGDASTPISLTSNNASLKVTNNCVSVEDGAIDIVKFIVIIKFVQGE